MTATTRRAALTALAGVPALAIPALAIAGFHQSRCMTSGSHATHSDSR